MANWEKHPISRIISEIEEMKFVLPVIQRRLVWEEDKMELLFDTVLKGDSFGGIMVIREERNTRPLFNYRLFTLDGEPVKSIDINQLGQTQNFVIDGQQRLQSFLIGLKGSYNGKILYFDLYSNFEKEFEFKFANDINSLPKKSKGDSNKTISEYKWYPVRDLFQNLKTSLNERQEARNIIRRDGVTDENLKLHIEENVAIFQRNIFVQSCVGICEVPIDKGSEDQSGNRQRIVELFRRLNDGGTKLSPFDLVASILKGFEWTMEGFLDEVLEGNGDIGLSQDNLIKLIFLLQDNYVKEMAQIESSDASFAVNNKERIKSCLIALRKFLHASQLFNFYKDGNRSFIPLFFIVYHLFNKKLDNKEIEAFFNNYDANNPDFVEMKRWSYWSLLNGVFRSRGAGWIPYKTGIKKILEEIKVHKNEIFPVDELFEVYFDHGLKYSPEYTSDNLDQFDHNFIYYLIYDRSVTIRVQDIDHIMPKSILQTKGFTPERINSIANFQLLDYGTNRGEKNAKELRVWVNNFVADKKPYATKHLIPTDETLWEEDKFVEFNNERAKLIVDKLSKFM